MKQYLERLLCVTRRAVALSGYCPKRGVRQSRKREIRGIGMLRALTSALMATDRPQDFEISERMPATRQGGLIGLGLLPMEECYFARLMAQFRVAMISVGSAAIQFFRYNPPNPRAKQHDPQRFLFGASRPRRNSSRSSLRTC